MKASEHVPPRLHELEALVMEEVWRQETATVRMTHEDKRAIVSFRVDLDLVGAWIVGGRCYRWRSNGDV